jgi:acyl dehydratase
MGTAQIAWVGESFESSVTVDADSVRDFAAACGDFNPLHHDEAVAARSRFGGLIAAGPHTASLLMARTATHFSQRAQPLGLEFNVRFNKAVRAGDTLRLRWTVTDVAPKPSLGGEFVTLHGEAINQAGEVVLSSVGLLLVTPAAPA